jgi:hypothetical protein
LIGAVLVVAGGCFVYREAFAGQVLAGRDIFRLYLPQAGFLAGCLSRGELPLWNPHVWLGQPFAATIQSQAFYPIHVGLLVLSNAIWVSTLQHVVHALIAVVGTWWLSRRLGGSQLAGALAGLAFGLGPLFSTLCISPNMAGSLAWSGCFLAAVQLHCRRPSLRSTSGVALVATASFLCGSPETLLWQSALALGAAIAWCGRDWRKVSGVGLGLLWAVAASAFVFVPAVELALRSTRLAATDQLLWSVSPTQVLAAALPAFDVPRGEYFGADQWLLSSQFLGSAICILALAAKWRSRRAFPFVLGALLLGALSLGVNFWPAAKLLALPPLSLFRYPAKYFLGSAFCVCVLAGQGFDRMAALARSGRPRPIAVAAILAGLFVALALTSLPGFLPLRAGAGVAPAWFSIVLACGALLFFALPRTLRRGRHFALGLLGVSVLELAIAQRCFWDLSWLPPERLATASSLVQGLSRPFEGRLSFEPHLDGNSPTDVQDSRDRLAPLRFMEEGLLAFEGYEPPIPRLAAELRLIDTRGVFDLVGVSLFTRPKDPPFTDLEEVGRGPGGWPVLYRSNTALPRAFIVHRSQLADDSQMRQALEDPSQPTRHTAFLAGGEALASTPCEGSTARLTEGETRQLSIDAQACAPGYLVVSDAFFPGWEATVNGVPSAIERADLALRAVKIPQGSSRIEMRYRPGSFVLGLWIALPALALIVFAQLRRPRKEGVRP